MFLILVNLILLWMVLKMAKYLIEIEEVKSCDECILWCSPAYYRRHCKSNESINSEGFDYENRIHKDCPLKKVEEDV